MCSMAKIMPYPSPELEFFFIFFFDKSIMGTNKSRKIKEALCT